MTLQLMPKVQFYFYPRVALWTALQGDVLRHPEEPIPVEVIGYALMGENVSAIHYACDVCEWKSEEFEFEGKWIPEPIFEAMKLHVQWHMFDQDLKAGLVGL
jgi:hypothetical protein